MRTKFLKTGQNFKPSIDRSTSAPKLGSITEGDEELARAGEGDEDEDGGGGGGGFQMSRLRGTWASLKESDEDEMDDDAFAHRSLDSHNLIFNLILISVS